MQKRAYVIAGAFALTIALSGGAGAVAGTLITSHDIQNDTIRSVDVKDGNLRAEDLRPGVVADFTKDTVFDDSALQAQIDQLEAEVDKLKADDASSANTNWVANPGTEIVDAHTVRLTLAEGNAAGVSVEIANLDMPVQATKTVKFTYKLENGAVYGGGAPRVFYEINGTYYNTNDAEPNDPGINNGDGTFTKTAVIPANGRVGNAGIAYDNGVPGTVTVTDLVISGNTVSFK